MSFTIQKAPSGNYDDPVVLSATLDENLAQLGLPPSKDSFLDDNQLFPDPTGQAIHLEQFFPSDIDTIEQIATDIERIENLVAVMKLLTNQQRQVLSLKYGLIGPAMTDEEIASHLELKPERLTRIKREGINSLRKLAHGYNL